MRGYRGSRPLIVHERHIAAGVRSRRTSRFAWRTRAGKRQDEASDSNQHTSHTDRPRYEAPCIDPGPCRRASVTSKSDTDASSRGNASPMSAVVASDPFAGNVESGTRRAPALTPRKRQAHVTSRPRARRRCSLPRTRVFPVIISKSTQPNTQMSRARPQAYPRLFRAHIRGGAEENTRSRHVHRRGKSWRNRGVDGDGADRLSTALARPKSSTSLAPSSSHHDVRGFEIAVDDATFMRCVERLRDLARDSGGASSSGRAPRAIRASNALPVDQFHNEGASG